MPPMRQQHPSFVRRLRAIGTAALAVAPLLAHAGYRDDVGFTKLQADLGATLPTGAGVVVSQVEASVIVDGQQTWVPDPSNGDFTGKSITQIYAAPAGLFSGHATAIGQDFYGNTISTSPGINAISVYWANRWIVEDFLWPSGTRRPLYSTSRIVNHSWVGATNNADSELLRRLDWVVETDDMLQVVSHAANGVANGNPLFSSAFNVIAVGRSADTANTGSAAVNTALGALDSTYIAGRARPDVVAPADSPSTAAGLVSSLVALLVQTGHANLASPSYTNRAGLVIRNAERTEVIKAALMAGADRVTANTIAPNLGLYRDSPANQTSNGLDLRYGAGQVNIRNSYWIMAGGEQDSTEDGGTGTTTARGFDFDPAFGGSAGANSTASYPLPMSATPQLLTTSLVWNIDINGGTQTVFNNYATFRDLALSVMDVSNPANPVTVYTSQSTTENTENAWLVIPPGAQYELQVTRGSGSAFSWRYAIAWQLLPDTDADGAYDQQDNCIDVPNGPMSSDAGGHSQLDGDGDRYGNACDADLNNTGLVTSIDISIMRSVINAADPVADLNGSGLVNSSDYLIARGSLNLAPGPSGLVP